MARKPRVEYAGAFYHVICRGNQRQVIFRSDTDRKYYLERLEHYRQRHGFKLYAYVLMSNHVHMLLETGQVLLYCIEVPGPRAKFSQLLHLTAEAYGVSERNLVQAGRQRRWIRARSMLVYLAREQMKVRGWGS
jgi:hypothetical protein